MLKIIRLNITIILLMLLNFNSISIAKLENPENTDIDKITAEPTIPTEEFEQYLNDDNNSTFMEDLPDEEINILPILDPTLTPSSSEEPDQIQPLMTDTDQATKDPSQEEISTPVTNQQPTEQPIDQPNAPIKNFNKLKFFKKNNPDPEPDSKNTKTNQ